jgi:hypothetical protein
MFLQIFLSAKGAGSRLLFMGNYIASGGINARAIFAYANAHGQLYHEIPSEFMI